MKSDSLLSDASSNDNKATKIDQVFATYHDKLRSYIDQAKKLNAKTIAVTDHLQDNALEYAFSIPCTSAATSTMSSVAKPSCDVDTNPLLLGNVTFEKFMSQDICLLSMTQANVYLFYNKLRQICGKYNILLKELINLC